MARQRTARIGRLFGRGLVPRGCSNMRLIGPARSDLAPCTSGRDPTARRRPSTARSWAHLVVREGARRGAALVLEAKAVLVEKLIDLVGSPTYIPRSSRNFRLREPLNESQ